MFRAASEDLNKGYIDFELDEPNRSYTAGQVITGRVVLRHANAAAQSELAHLTLSGVAKSKILRYYGRSHGPPTIHRRYRSRIPLLNIAQPLTTHHESGASIRVWPFAMTVPSSSIIKGTPPIKAKFNRDEYFTTLEPSERFVRFNPTGYLPPSMSFGNVSYDNHFKCIIEYTLTAYVTAGPRVLEGKASISLTPPAPSLLAPPRDFRETLTVRSLRLLPENADRKLSLVERTKSLVDKTSLPSFSFDANLAVPDHLYSGQPFSFHLKVFPLPQRSSISETPAITLTSCKLQIDSLHYVRATGFGVQQDCRKMQPAVQAQVTPLNNITSFTKANNYTLSFNPTPLSSGDAAKPLGPTVRVDNITRIYFLNIKCVLSCAGEDLTVAADTELVVEPSPVHILPQEPDTTSREPPPPFDPADAGPSSVPEAAPEPEITKAAEARETADPYRRRSLDYESSSGDDALPSYQNARPAGSSVPPAPTDAKR